MDDQRHKFWIDSRLVYLYVNFEIRQHCAVECVLSGTRPSGNLREMFCNVGMVIAGQNGPRVEYCTNRGVPVIAV
jgi:hypothetical protein